MRIGVISNTHGLLRPEALRRLAGVEHIIHAGDIGSPAIVPRLAEIAPVTAIRGNVDIQPWAQDFPARRLVNFGGRTICVLHDRGALDIDPVAAGFDMVVSGHSHRPRDRDRERGGPPQPGQRRLRRFRLPVTLAIVELTSEVIRAEIHELVDPVTDRSDHTP